LQTDSIDWSRWVARIRGTLLFCRRPGEVLLMRKKRGLGAGKINAPGGKVEPGESPLQGAIRETEEEVCVVAHAADWRGELFFQFVDGLSIHVDVFESWDFSGEPAETDEALPAWFAEAQIPYAEMWEDDVAWLPVMLAGQRLRFWATFDGDRMLDHRLELVG
jgi:8-oxo-dGTP diphosphatase